MVFVIHCLRLPPMKVLRVELAWATWLENTPCCPCAGPGILYGRGHQLVGPVSTLLGRRCQDTMDRGYVVKRARFSQGDVWGQADPMDDNPADRA